MQYAKAFVQVIATLLTALLPFIIDGALSSVDVINLCIVGCTALGVAVVPNLSAGVARYAKAVLAVLGAVLVLLTSFIADGHLSIDEIVQLASAALGAIGVYALPGPLHPAPVASDGAHVVTNLEG
ncbi:hypothetical protein ACWEOE_28830 [Amycolatopsis sp. NPDC004368]